MIEYYTTYRCQAAESLTITIVRGTQESRKSDLNYSAVAAGQETAPALLAEPARDYTEVRHAG